MKNRLKPDMEFDSIQDISSSYFTENGIKGVVFDIDNTLVPYLQAKPDEKVIGFLKMLSDGGIRIGIISNAKKERVINFTEDLSVDGKIVPSVFKAGKPFGKSFRHFTKMFNVKDNEMAIVGDQLFTDILGGNLSGFHTVLVKPIAPEQESSFIKFKRRLEKIFYVGYEKKN